MRYIPFEVLQFDIIAVIRVFFDKSVSSSYTGQTLTEYSILMTLTEQIAKHFREIHFGGNWTSVNLKESLVDVDWQQATTKVYSLNTIAALVYHSNYYVSAVLKVLQGEALNASDKYSFDLPPIQSPEDWEKLLKKTWAEAENFATLIEQLPESRLWETFTDEKYGNYYRNLNGIIEHTHYHLGQIVLLKKILSELARTNTESEANNKANKKE